MAMVPAAKASPKSGAAAKSSPNRRISDKTAAAAIVNLTQNSYKKQDEEDMTYVMEALKTDRDLLGACKAIVRQKLELAIKRDKLARGVRTINDVPDYMSRKVLSTVCEAVPAIVQTLMRRTTQCCT